MSGKVQVRLAVLAAVAALVALFAGALTAQADTVRELTLEVTTPNDGPAVTSASTPTDLKFTVTNSDSSTKELGAIELEITANGAFGINVVGAVTAPVGKTWSLDAVNGHVVQLSADDAASTLLPGQWVSVVINVTPPNNIGADTVYDVDVMGRQATDFNDNGAPGNTFVEVEGEDVVGPFDIRNSDGSTTEDVFIRTDEVLVTGLAVDCSPNEPCTGSLTQFNTTVTVTANCGTDGGTLVLDTVEIANVTQIGAAAFYDAFDGCDVLKNEDYDDDPNTVEPAAPQVTSADSPYIVTVDFTFDNSLIDSKGGLQFAARYPGGDASEFDPLYVGDDEPLPSCKKDIVVNCVAFIKGGPGVTQAQVKMLLKDPFSRGF